MQRRRTSSGGSLARSNALTKRSGALSRGNGLRSRIARAFGDSLPNNEVVGNTTLAPYRASRGASGNKRRVPRCRGRKNGGDDGPEGSGLAGGARNTLPPRPGGDVGGTLRPHRVAPRHDATVPTFSNDLNAMPISRLGDGAEGASFGTQHIGR